MRRDAWKASSRRVLVEGRRTRGGKRSRVARKGKDGRRGRRGRRVGWRMIAEAVGGGQI